MDGKFSGPRVKEWMTVDYLSLGTVTLCDLNLTRREDETLQADYLKQPKKTNLLMD